MTLSYSASRSARRPNSLRRWIVAAAFVALCVGPAGASESYVKLIGGYGDLDDGGGLVVDDSRFASSADSSYDLGFRSGLAYGWNLSDRFALEGEYLYSTNDLDEVVFSDGQRFADGNYASVTVSANGYAFFGSADSLRPYVGVGVAWVQEVDIDFECDLREGEEEISFSTDDVGFQLMVGMRWRLNETWDLDLQARWLSVSSLALDAEPGSGQVLADYRPTSLLMGLSYRF